MAKYTVDYPRMEQNTTSRLVLTTDVSGRIRALLFLSILPLASILPFSCVLALGSLPLTIIGTLVVLATCSMLVLLPFAVTLTVDKTLRQIIVEKTSLLSTLPFVAKPKQVFSFDGVKRIISIPSSSSQKKNEFGAMILLTELNEIFVNCHRDEPWASLLYVTLMQYLDVQAPADKPESDQEMPEVPVGGVPLLRPERIAAARAGPEVRRLLLIAAAASLVVAVVAAWAAYRLAKDLDPGMVSVVGFVSAPLVGLLVGWTVNFISRGHHDQRFGLVAAGMTIVSLVALDVLLLSDRTLEAQFEFNFFDIVITMMAVLLAWITARKPANRRR